MPNGIIKIKNFATIHFESQVMPFITKNILNELPAHNGNLLVEDIRHLRSLDKVSCYSRILCSQLLNNATNINRSLIKIHNSLKPGGIFIGRVETLEHRKRRIATYANRFQYKIIVIYEFIIKRVGPKLFGFRFLFKRLGITKHHVLSKCEALGRLRYCGFEIIDTRETDKYLYFIAAKNSQPLIEKPHEGILIKIQKVGKDGRIINCYKLRTMHAYANFLHDYVLNNHELDDNGKIVGDYRKTNWGQFLRKSWLDEIPQILNIIKGDLSFIGLRPLSQAFLSLYPEDWRKERTKIKPGFVPPYYADCPKTFEEIVASEKRYYYLKKKHPITADIFYLIRVIASFVSGRARTG